MSQVEHEQSIGRGTAELVQVITEYKLGCAVPDDTVSAWITLSRTIRVADDYIDSETELEARVHIYDNAIDYLSEHTHELGLEGDILSKEMGCLRSELACISDNQRALFMRSLTNLLRVTEQIKHSEDPADLARLSKLEGQITARLFTAFLPEEYSEHEKYKEYLQYVTRLGRGINALDSLIDLSEDYDRGEIKVQPTFGNSVVFAAQTINNILFLATHTSPRLIASMKRGIHTIVEDRNGDSSIHFPEL